MNYPKAAVVGMGFMGPTHIQALRRLGVPLAGVMGVDLAEGQAAAERLNIDRVYRDFDEMTADPQVGVVHICTPNYLHYPMARQALLSGKHVICEKPLTMNLAQSGELAEMARELGLLGVVNYNLRFYPVCQEARARIQNGELGEIRLTHGAYLQDWLALATDWNWRLLSKEGGGMRAVTDIGTHWLDLITWITGLEISEVMADMATFIATRYRPRVATDTFGGKFNVAKDAEPVEIDTEDAAQILIRYKNGARGSLNLSQVSPGRKNYFWWELAGSKASLRWDQESPNHLWFGYREQRNQILVKDPSLMDSRARPFAGFPGGHAEGYSDTFYQLFRLVYVALAKGAPVDPAVPTFQTGHQELLLCEAIQKSAQELRWVSVNPSTAH